MEEIRNFDGEYAFLSNRYPFNAADSIKICLELDGMIFTSVEAAYQAAKTLNSEDRKKISEMTPEEAKAFGHSNKIFFRKDWHDDRKKIMYNLIWQKFYGNKQLRKMLLDTGDAQLIKENSEGDKFWGICNGEGENNIGIILMDVRKKIRDCTFLKD